MSFKGRSRSLAIALLCSLNIICYELPIVTMSMSRTIS